MNASAAAALARSGALGACSVMSLQPMTAIRRAAAQTCTCTSALEVMVFTAILRCGRRQTTLESKFCCMVKYAVKWNLDCGLRLRQSVFRRATQSKMLDKSKHGWKAG